MDSQEPPPKIWVIDEMPLIGSTPRSGKTAEIRKELAKFLKEGRGLVVRNLKAE